MKLPHSYKNSKNTCGTVSSQLDAVDISLQLVTLGYY